MTVRHTKCPELVILLLKFRACMTSSLLCVPLCESFPFNYSWDHMVKYDLPAMLKFALATTGQPDLFYIGHSQGTLISFACFSRDLELAKKVRYSFYYSFLLITVGITWSSMIYRPC